MARTASPFSARKRWSCAGVPRVASSSFWPTRSPGLCPRRSRPFPSDIVVTPCGSIEKRTMSARSITFANVDIDRACHSRNSIRPRRSAISACAVARSVAACAFMMLLLFRGRSRRSRRALVDGWRAIRRAARLPGRGKAEDEPRLPAAHARHADGSAEAHGRVPDRREPDAASRDLGDRLDARDPRDEDRALDILAAAAQATRPRAPGRPVAPSRCPRRRRRSR